MQCEILVTMTMTLTNDLDLAVHAYFEPLCKNCWAKHRIFSHKLAWAMAILWIKKITFACRIFFPSAPFKCTFVQHENYNKTFQFLSLHIGSIALYTYKRLLTWQNIRSDAARMCKLFARGIEHLFIQLTLFLKQTIHNAWAAYKTCSIYSW